VSVADADLVLQLRRLLETRPSGILSDIDGTLSRIADSPDAAVVDPGIREALRALSARVDVIGVATGRAARDARRMLDLDDVVYLGNHGMERLEGEQLVVATEAAASVPAIDSVLETTKARIAEPGIVFENKGVTGSIHYRNTANPTAMRERILEVVSPLANTSGLRVSEGRMVIELRPEVRLNKGTALRQIVEEYALLTIIFLGDDVTDIDAMRMLAERRAAGTVTGLSIGVIDTESPPELTEFADVLVDGVDGVRHLLIDLAAQFNEER